MNIVIAGVGEVGLHVARVLARDGHQLTLVDRDPEAIERAEEGVDALTLRGRADSPATLREANVQSVDLFASLTADSAVNLIAGIMAKELGARRVVARVSDQHYFEDSHGVYPGYMGLDLVVNEQAVVARELLRLARAHTATLVESFCDHHIEMVQLPIDTAGPAVNRALTELPLPPHVHVCAVQRRDTVLIPNASDQVHVGDQIVLVGPASHMRAAERLFGVTSQRTGRRTMLIGGGGVGVQVARALSNEGTDVTIVERRRPRAEALAQTLAHAQVLCGDGTDLNLLDENGAAQSDVFCALSGLDEVNLMAALLARDLGARRCITLVHKPDYVTVCRHLGLENTVSPRLVVSREIIRQLRQGHLVHSAEVFDGEGLVKEIQVLDTSAVIGRSLADLTLPRTALVCAHVTPSGASAPQNAPLAPGDRVVFFSTRHGVGPLEKMLRRPFAAR